MWALFYLSERVSRVYPNRTSVLRDAVKAGIADAETRALDDGYEIRRMETADAE